MSTILMFVMDLDSLFPCKFTHICRVQIVIILYPKPDKMPQVLSLMTLGKILAKKIVNSLQIWAQTVKAKVVSKGHFYFSFYFSFFHFSFSLLRIWLSILTSAFLIKAETTIQFQGLICFWLQETIFFQEPVFRIHLLYCLFK